MMGNEVEQQKEAAAFNNQIEICIGMTDIRKDESSEARDHIIQNLQRFAALYPSMQSELEFIATKGDAKAVTDEIEKHIEVLEDMKLKLSRKQHDMM